VPEPIAPDVSYARSPDGVARRGRGSRRLGLKPFKPRRQLVERGEHLRLGRQGLPVVQTKDFIQVIVSGNEGVAVDRREA
jgi:hypothetical protein